MTQMAGSTRKPKCLVAVCFPVQLSFLSFAFFRLISGKPLPLPVQPISILYTDPIPPPLLLCPTHFVVEGSSLSNMRGIHGTDTVISTGASSSILKIKVFSVAWDLTTCVESSTRQWPHCSPTGTTGATCRYKKQECTPFTTPSSKGRQPRVADSGQKLLHIMAPGNWKTLAFYWWGFTRRILIIKN